MSKIITCEEFQETREILRQGQKKVIHCHGVFDLLHPGHIAHLEEAKGLGDILVVSVTSAPFVNKGPGRPYFSDELRLKSLAALESVDYVLLSEAATALEMIDIVQPDLYVKGSEYSVAENDVTENINREEERVLHWGGDIYFTNGVTFSSTKLLNNYFEVFPPNVKEFAREFSREYPFEEIRRIVETMKEIKVLVVGDIIIDEYVMCNVQGLTTKDRAYSVKYLNEERYLGGVLAIARHLANFSDHVAVSGILGDETIVHRQILNELSHNIYLDLEFDSNFRTIIKRRYVERKGVRNQYEKILSINYLENEENRIERTRQRFSKKLEEKVSKYDLVVVADYGHGLLDQTAMDVIQDKAKFLALNCQTNSSNYGENLITKYRRADSFTLDEREIRLAMTERSGSLEILLRKLRDYFDAPMGWLTLGSKGSLAIERHEKMLNQPALTLNVQDTVGAGDAFFVLASLAAYLNAPSEIGSFLGNIAGALAANYLGNSHSVRREDLLKFATTLLKF